MFGDPPLYDESSFEQHARLSTPESDIFDELKLGALRGSTLSWALIEAAAQSTAFEAALAHSPSLAADAATFFIKSGREPLAIAGGVILLELSVANFSLAEGLWARLAEQSVDWTREAAGDIQSRMERIDEDSYRSEEELAARQRFFYRVIVPWL